MKPKNVPDKHKKPTLIYYGEKKIEAKSLIRIQVKNPNVGNLNVFHVAITSDGNVEIFPAVPSAFKVLDVDDLHPGCDPY